MGRGENSKGETSFACTFWPLSSGKFLLTLLALCVGTGSFVLAFAFFLQVNDRCSSSSAYIEDILDFGGS